MDKTNEELATDPARPNRDPPATAAKIKPAARDYPLVRRPSISFATSSQTAANSRNSSLTEVSSAVSASCRYFAACSRR